MNSQKESKELESFVDGALDVPGGSAFGRALAAERSIDTRLRHLRDVEVAETAPAPMIRPPTVVVEIAGRELGAAVVGVLREEGYQAVACGGPASLPTGRCPLVEGRECPLVAQADVVVHALGLRDPEGRAVFEAQRRRWLGRPNVVVTGLEGPGNGIGAHRGQAVVIDGHLSREILLEAVESALQS
jgi:hypothetical protein